MSNLTERRAIFVYEAARLAAIAAIAPVIPEPWSRREDPFRRQFLDVIERQCGERRSRSPEELHGSWMQAYFAMGWKYGEARDPVAKMHPDLVPYANLGQLERDKDAVFVSLCEIARQWIYDEPVGTTDETTQPTVILPQGQPSIGGTPDPNAPPPPPSNEPNGHEHCNHGGDGLCCTPCMTGARRDCDCDTCRQMRRSGQQPTVTSEKRSCWRCLGDRDERGLCSCGAPPEECRCLISPQSRGAE